VHLDHAVFRAFFMGEIKMNDLVQSKKQNLPSSAMSEDELINVLKSSLYPGAQDGSIKLVLGYCRAAGLDPIQKPVHIVPMYDAKVGGMRDVIMPGIGSYRTQAARSGEYAGVSDAEYGEDVTEIIGGQQITYPAWCRITVKRLMGNGIVAEFTATERWKENYATKGGKDKSIAPNAMWSRRPYAQIAKCAEAQALRKAFPELGSQPTSDEMEGKIIEDSQFNYQAQIDTVQQPAALDFYPEDKFNQNKAKWREAVLMGKKTTQQIIDVVSSKAILTNEQENEIDSWNHEND